ncbi:MAG: divalent-cation tolerance protein CutA [Helicobacteraceae bacterium]|nr:divalent-cation tolerance protein CutA [Helicobacteraceae bacterium]
MIIILSTTHRKKEAKYLAKVLVERKFASCVQINKIKSCYIWGGKICSHDEWKLSIKTRKKYIQKIKKLFDKRHSYEVFEFIIIKCKATKNYNKWLKNTL